jgi:hypothetical protein
MSIPAIKSGQRSVPGRKVLWRKDFSVPRPHPSGSAAAGVRPADESRRRDRRRNLERMPILLRGAMKPIPTVRKPLPSINLQTGMPEEAVWERSDVCSVPAVSVVAEAIVALVLLDALLETVPANSEGQLRTESRRCGRGPRRSLALNARFRP